MIAQPKTQYILTHYHHTQTVTRKGATYIAIYHLSIKIISRGKGKSAVAAAAYRAGEKITNERDGLIHDYTRKGGVTYTEILLPGHAPPEYADRAILWNAVEKTEKAKNAQLARENSNPPAKPGVLHMRAKRYDTGGALRLMVGPVACNDATCQL